MHFRGQLDKENSINELTGLKILKISGHKALNADFLEWSISNLTNLQHIDLSSNGFSGNLCYLNLQNLKKLEYINLSHNELKGDLNEWKISLQELKYLKLNKNKLKGELCDWKFGRIKFNAQSPNLKYLDLSDNELEGSLHDCDKNHITINNFKYLEYLNLGNNPNLVFDYNEWKSFLNFTHLKQYSAWASNITQSELSQIQNKKIKQKVQNLADSWGKDEYLWDSELKKLTLTVIH
jgi:Leucine-rich repeat (LRR) protein